MYHTFFVFTINIRKLKKKYTDTIRDCQMLKKGMVDWYQYTEGVRISVNQVVLIVGSKQNVSAITA